MNAFFDERNEEYVWYVMLFWNKFVTGVCRLFHLNLNLNSAGRVLNGFKTDCDGSAHKTMLINLPVYMSRFSCLEITTVCGQIQREEK